MWKRNVKFKRLWRAVFVLAFAAMGSLAWNSLHESALAAGQMLSRDEAQRLGLKRAWFAQVQVDRARHRVQRAILEGDRLTVLTTAGVVQDFDALTGETFWTTPVGNVNYPSLGPAADDKHVAILNGSTLYVLRRQDGKPLLNRRVGSSPGAAPAVSQEYVFVPLINGRVEGYPLNQGEDKSHSPWYYQADGRVLVAPMTTPQSVVWSTDRGRVYVATSLHPEVRFRLESGSNIVAPAAYRAPRIFVATTNGDVFAMDETVGERKWKYSTGYPIERAPAAVGDRVYVTSAEPALHAIDAKTGAAIWVAPKMTQFAAASLNRVYGFDDLRGLVVLDAKTGAVLDRMQTDGSSTTLVNDQTDRLYLLSSGGLLQCFHEIGADKPHYHNSAEKTAKPETSSATGVDASTPSAAGTAAPPADEEAAPKDDGAVNPFGGLNDEPREGAEAPPRPGNEGFNGPDDNPFGDEN